LLIVVLLPNFPWSFLVDRSYRGGKTLASLGFALELRNDLKETDHLCYTLYQHIEQTADVFRTVFGYDQVIEHHSNFDSDLSISEDTIGFRELGRSQLIVTTKYNSWNHFLLLGPGVVGSFIICRQ
jgi:CRISPR/Cas system-associated endonuclease/helicase Cas3